jgi:hypothetical protein
VGLLSELGGVELGKILAKRLVPLIGGDASGPAVAPDALVIAWALRDADS